jgi:hypothetical protein
MIKIALAVCCVLLSGTAVEDRKRAFLEASPAWLAEKGCTQPDPQQCALERKLKSTLAWGRVELGPAADAEALRKELLGN